MDIALQENGMLLGMIVDVQGQPASGAAVSLRQANREVVRFAADAQGRFAVTGLRGGMYEIATPRSTGLYRLWAANTAPPSAQAGVLIVEGAAQVRGQSPFPVASIGRVATVTGLIAGGIAVPVVYGTKNTKWIPASP